MIESHISSTDLTNNEPKLSDFLTSAQLTQVVKDAKDLLLHRLENRLPNKGYDLRRLCKRLNLTVATTSSEDTIGRRRLVLQLSSAAANTFKLEGSNDESTFTEIFSSTVLSLSTTTSFTKVIGVDDSNVGVFKYYKLTQVTGSTSLSLAYLVETTFELPHLYLALSMAFKKLQFLRNDAYEQQAGYYEELFNQAWDNMKYSFDSDDDDDLDDDDKLIKSSSVMLKR